MLKDNSLREMGQQLNSNIFFHSNQIELHKVHWRFKWFSMWFKIPLKQQFLQKSSWIIRPSILNRSEFIKVFLVPKFSEWSELVSQVESKHKKSKTKHINEMQCMCVITRKINIYRIFASARILWYAIFQ